MESSHWLGTVKIGKIYPGDGMQHDGFVEVHVGVTFNGAGTEKLNEYLKANIKGLDMVINTDHKIKLVASSKTDGTKPTEGDLKKLANSAVRKLKAWASSLSTGDIVFCTSTIYTEDRIKAAMADHSETRHHLASDT